MTNISRDQALAHFGVKGMRWGVRNETSSVSREPKKGISTKKKVAIGVGVLAVGTAVSLAVLGKHGNLPIKDISKSVSLKKSSSAVKVSRQTVDRGSKAVKDLSDKGLIELKFKQIVAEFDADIAKAHEEETRWMLKNVPSFNPRDNPYLPEYELQRLRGG